MLILVKKFVAIVLSVSGVFLLSGCGLSYEPPLEDPSGGDVRAAVYGMNPLGFQPGTGLEINSHLSSMVDEYNILISEAFTPENSLGVVDRLISGGAVPVASNWTLYRSCPTDFGDFEQITNVYLNDSIDIQNSTKTFVDSLLNNGWYFLPSTDNKTTFLGKKDTGITYTSIINSTTDYVIYVSDVSVNGSSFEIGFKSSGCLPLDNLPKGEIIKDVNSYVGIWRAGFSKQNW